LDLSGPHRLSFKEKCFDDRPDIACPRITTSHPGFRHQLCLDRGSFGGLKKEPVIKLWELASKPLVFRVFDAVLHLAIPAFQKG